MRALAVAVLIALAARAAYGHDAPSPLAVVIELDRGKLQVMLRWYVDDGAGARELRERFDADADGVLDDGERAALGTWMTEQARRAFALDVRGAAVALELQQSSFDIPDGAATHLAAAARYVGDVTWTAGDNQVVVRAETKERAVTPVAIHLGKKSRLSVSAKTGRASPGAPFTLVVSSSK